MTDKDLSAELTASEAQPAQPALREDDIAEMLCRAAGPYASRKGSSGLTAWCRANGVAKSHASDFVNRKGPPRNDLLTALGIERTYRAALAAPVTELRECEKDKRAKHPTFAQQKAARKKLPFGCVVGTASGTAMCGEGQTRFGGGCIYPRCEEQYNAAIRQQGETP